METQQIQPAPGGSHYFVFHHSVVRGVTKCFHLNVQPSIAIRGGRWRKSQVCSNRSEPKNAIRVASHVHGKKKSVESTSSKPSHTKSGNPSITSLGSSVREPHKEMVSEDCDYDSGVDSDDELHVYRGLVLDVSYRPVNIVCWKRALCLEILEKADVLEYYDQVVLSTTRAFFIPAVLRVNGFVHAPKHQTVKLSLSRNNVFLRDKYRCQYCNMRESLTIDHVQAASRGGPWSWENLVTACSSCNLKKGDKTLEEAHMKLLRPPREPRELNSLDLPPNYKTFRSLSPHARTPVQWLEYLPTRPPQL